MTCPGSQSPVMVKPGLCGFSAHALAIPTWPPARGAPRQRLSSGGQWCPRRWQWHLRASTRSQGDGCHHWGRSWEVADALAGKDQNRNVTFPSPQGRHTPQHPSTPHRAPQTFPPSCPSLQLNVFLPSLRLSPTTRHVVGAQLMLKNESQLP